MKELPAQASAAPGERCAGCANHKIGRWTVACPRASAVPRSGHWERSDGDVGSSVPENAQNGVTLSNCFTNVATPVGVPKQLTGYFSGAQSTGFGVPACAPPSASDRRSRGEPWVDAEKDEERNYHTEAEGPAPAVDT